MMRRNIYFRFKIAGTSKKKVKAFEEYSKYRSSLSDSESMDISEATKLKNLVFLHSLISKKELKKFGEFSVAFSYLIQQKSKKVEIAIYFN